MGKKTGKDIKLQIHIYNALHKESDCEWRVLPKKYGKWYTIYMKFNRWSKNGTIAKAIAFFL